MGLDLGLKKDRTVLTVCHAEPQPAAPDSLPRIVLDRLAVLSGSREHPVQLAEVEAVAHEAATTYHAQIRLDPWQAVALSQRLRTRGVAVEEWSFTPASIGRLASTLHLLLREHRLALPDDPELLTELSSVRLRETTPGVLRLNHDAGQHDDRAVALGLAALALTEHPPTGRGSIWSPAGVAARVVRTMDDGGRAPPLGQAARHGPRGLAALLVRDSANDPRRVHR